MTLQGYLAHEKRPQELRVLRAWRIRGVVSSSSSSLFLSSLELINTKSARLSYESSLEALLISVKSFRLVGGSLGDVMCRIGVEGATRRTLLHLVGFYRERVSMNFFFGYEVCCTNDLLLRMKIMRCSKLHLQKVFRLKLFSYKILCDCTGMRARVRLDSRASVFMGFQSIAFACEM